MPSRIGATPKKKLPRKKKRKDKKRRPSRKGLLGRARSIVHRPKKPSVAQADAEPPFVPMLFFRDLDAAVHFFTVKLGFDLVYQRHTIHGYTGLCAVRYPGVYLLLGHVDGLDAASRANFDSNAHGVGVHFVITVMDVDVFHRELEARQVTTLGAPRLQLWGRKEFRLADPLEGYLFTFSQPEPR